jgi:hypothetical protein
MVIRKLRKTAKGFYAPCVAQSASTIYRPTGPLTSRELLTVGKETIPMPEYYNRPIALRHCILSRLVA